MDDKALVEAANKNIEVSGGTPLHITGDTEMFHTTQVFAEYQGHPVRVEFTETDSNPAEYRFNATVYDAETDEQIATGNGGTDWQDALSIVHWQALKNHWA